VSLDDLPAHGESDAAAVEVVTVGSLEHLERVVAETRRYSDPVVVDVEQPEAVPLLAPIVTRGGSPDLNSRLRGESGLVGLERRAPVESRARFRAHRCQSARSRRRAS